MRCPAFHTTTTKRLSVCRSPRRRNNSSSRNTSCSSGAEEQLVVKEYDLRGPKPELARAQTDWGGVVNYNVFTSGVSSADARPLSINGIPISINGIPSKFTGAPLEFHGASATF